MQSARNAARKLRRKGYELGTVVQVKNPHKYINRWRSAI